MNALSLFPGSSDGILAQDLNPGRLRDSYGRAITDLRVSITDRCNYRCVYCRTGNDGAQYAELPHADYLRMIKLFVSLGIEKIRLTGGEPLLRDGLLDLIREISQLRMAFNSLSPMPKRSSTSPITTNGHLLAGLAKPLKDAGLSRITVSMDAVDAETFTAITRVPRSFDRVLAGIRAAADAGLGPVKVNCVLLRGFNDSQIEAFGEFSRREGVIVRFIEWMPLEEDRSWTPEAVVPLEEIVSRLNAYRPLVPLAAHAASETARRYTFDDGIGEIGIIAPVSHPFCGHCSRIRLTSDGKIRTCLFSQSGSRSGRQNGARCVDDDLSDLHSTGSLCARKRAITSANRASRNRLARWFTSAASVAVRRNATSALSTNYPPAN